MDQRLILRLPLRLPNPCAGVVNFTIPHHIYDPKVASLPTHRHSGRIDFFFISPWRATSPGNSPTTKSANLRGVPPALLDRFAGIWEGLVRAPTLPRVGGGRTFMRDLKALLRDLRPTLRPGVYVFCTVPED